MKHKAGILLSLLAFLIVNASSLEAATITVNSLLDNTLTDGNCTLREAMVNANANGISYSDCAAGSGADTIRFSVSGTITLINFLPGTTDPLGLTIDGTGQSVTITRIGYAAIYLNLGEQLTLNNLTFANCSNTTLGSGGAINNTMGNLTINNCTFSNNSAPVCGGAIFSSGILTVTNSIFTGNYSNGGGGGICSTNTIISTLTVTNSTFTDNFAEDSGGGIYNSGPATITGSTIEYNDAGIDGGGISNSGTANLTNVTISGNESDVGDEPNESGGGIYNSGTLNMTNVTIANNIAYLSQGDGIYNAGTATLLNTLIANNNDQNCAGAGTLNATFSLSSDPTCFTASPPSGNVINPNPLIGPLANNGGPTQTHALLAGSPAINTANPSSFPTTDQRGITRPQGAGADIGAYEYQVTAIPTMNEWGMIIFMVLAGLGSVYYLRRQRKA